MEIKLKKENGVTLIALIVTVIVLMLVASVSVRLVLRNNMIEKAGDAKDEFESTLADEEKELDEFEKTLLGDNYGENNNNSSEGDDDPNGEIVKKGWVLGEDGITIINEATGETKTIGDTLTNDEVLTALGSTGGTYKDSWTIIGAKDKKLKLLSEKNMPNSVEIGYNDPGAIEAIPVANETAVTEEKKLQRAMWSYRHAVETLDEEAKNRNRH